VRGGQDLTVHDTWSNSQLQALVKAHARLIRDYNCAEWRTQDPAIEMRAPATSGADQVPQVTTPLLIPPLNQLAQLPAARAHGENAENAQEGRGLRMPHDDDVFYLFLQKQKIGAELHIYLEEGTYHKRLFRGPNTNDMKNQRRITREIMRGWAPHSDARENGAPQPRAMALSD
jgi:hypothetical protein